MILVLLIAAFFAIRYFRLRKFVRENPDYTLIVGVVYPSDEDVI